ncbi:hypothetical protein ACHAWF_011926 [Thalassiosira exigua]
MAPNRSALGAGGDDREEEDESLSTLSSRRSSSSSSEGGSRDSPDEDGDDASTHSTPSSHARTPDPASPTARIKKPPPPAGTFPDDGADAASGKKKPPRLVLPPPSSPRRRPRAGPRPHDHAAAVRIAPDGRVRSSRLFFVLLHLVGVSTNVPYGRDGGGGPEGGRGGGAAGRRAPGGRWLSLAWQGVTPVRPAPQVKLEKLDVASSRRGLAGTIERAERGRGYDPDEVLERPVWLQAGVAGRAAGAGMTDAAAGAGDCLEPGGRFGECGDASLWRVRRRPTTRRQLREKRYRAREERRRDKEKSRDGTRTTNSQKDHQESPPSSVCVWPFFCEKGSQVGQPSWTERDEVYGFEYDRPEHEEGFAIQLVDADMTVRLGEGWSRRRQRRRLFWGFHGGERNEDEENECLLSFPSGDSKVNEEGSLLQIGPCSSEEAWTWHVSRDGILVRVSTKTERRTRKRRWKISPRKASAAATAHAGKGNGKGEQPDSGAHFMCVNRANSTRALLLPCDVSWSQSHVNDDVFLVSFSLVRYPSVPSKRSPSFGQQPSDSSEDEPPSWEPWTAMEGPSAASPNASPQAVVDNVTNGREEDSDQEQHLPTSRRSSRDHASAGSPHRTKVDLKSAAGMLRAGPEPGGGGGGQRRDEATTTSSASQHIRDAPVTMNGVAFHDQLMNRAEGKGKEAKASKRKGPSSTKLRADRKDGQGGARRRATKIHDDPSEARGGENGHGSGDSSPHRPRKIPVHPYIQSSKDFVWVDPLTSLEYPTDLCGYLGHTKKEAGRHTIVGVGQYYRTAFNIKVYGVALYVAKRDVLADPKFGEYATLSSDDLRQRPDFYDHLMNMPQPGEDPSDAIGGFFDRTLFIKINMQLSTDAMRKSLESDWSLLTEEMKSTIIESSFEERMGDERMQRRIQSKENSSNCSCGQSAPAELNADPSCCARGTELVFTWRKNGNFEIRLDGRLMDVFPRQDIARGIFAEYLNDNPISLDAKARFADGFPFLLAPLAQVKGMSSAVPNQAHESPKRPKSSHGHNPMHRLMDAAVHSMGAMNAQVHTLSRWMQDSAAEVSSSALGSAMGAARGLNEELDRQRMDLVEGAVALQKEGMEMLSSLIKMSAEEDGLALVIVNQAMPSQSPFSDRFDTFSDDKMTTPQLIPDEIGISIEPTMNFSHWLFFTTVHVYLLLLFVVSVQGSATVVRRRILEA